MNTYGFIIRLNSELYEYKEATERNIANAYKKVILQCIYEYKLPIQFNNLPTIHFHMDRNNHFKLIKSSSFCKYLIEPLVCSIDETSTARFAVFDFMEFAGYSFEQLLDSKILGESELILYMNDGTNWCLTFDQFAGAINMARI
jgi:hypothetical protein